MQNPRVAHLSHSAAPSGAELFLLRVAVASGSAPVVILGEDGPLVGMLEQAGVTAVIVPVDERVRSHGAARRGAAIAKGLSTWAGARRVARALREHDVDVVLTHSAKAHVYGGIAAALAGVPVASYVHDLVGASGSRSDALLLRAALATFPRVLLTNSETTRSTLGRLAPRTTVVGCPVTARPVPEHRGPYTVAMIGRLSEWKGQDIAIRAFAAACASGLAPDARLHIVGGPLFAGDEEYARTLETLVTELGVGERVDFRGHRTDVAAEYAAADVVVHASRRPEAFGQVVIEAMAAGRAVIAADAGGPSELIEHGRNGLLVGPGDVRSLADAILVLQDPQHRRRLVAAAQSTARAFDLPVIVGALERELERAC